MSAFFARLWTFAKPIVTNPATWTAVIGILGTFFGAPMLSPAPTVSLPPTASVKPMGLLQLQAAHTGSSLDWVHDAPDATVLPQADGKSVIMQFPTAGTYRVHGHVARYGKMAHAHTLVTVGDSPTPPVPPGPTPPVPPVPPVPPTPPAPIPAKAVLIVIDAENVSKLPPAQALALTADSVRQYMNSAFPKSWRILAADGDVSNESQLWQDAFAKAKGKTPPWVVVSDGKTGFEGPLPADTDSLLVLLKKYGG